MLSLRACANPGDVLIARVHPFGPCRASPPGSQARCWPDWRARVRLAAADIDLCAEGQGNGKKQSILIVGLFKFMELLGCARLVANTDYDVDFDFFKPKLFDCSALQSGEAPT